MQKCCVCGIKDQDYDKTGFQDDTGYYCFNCKPKGQSIQVMDKTNLDVGNTHSETNSSSFVSKSIVRQTSTNAVASLIKGFSVIIGFLFFIFAIIFSMAIPSDDGFGSFIVFIIYFGIGFIISLFMYAAGEIVQLLHNIDNNTK